MMRMIFIYIRKHSFYDLIKICLQPFLNHDDILMRAKEKRKDI